VRRLAPLFCGLLFASCAKSDAFRPLREGDPAPEYAATALAGDTVRISELRGQAVLVNVWATWCLPCQREMPSIQRLADRFADSGLTVLAVSVDDPGADGSIEAFRAEHGIRLTVLRDPGKRIQRIFRTFGVPETFLLDRGGRIAARWIGEFDADGEAARSAVRSALAAGQ